MRKLLLLAFLALTACSDTEKVTEIDVSPPDWAVKKLTQSCDKPDQALVRLELVEHDHFKCSWGWNAGDYKCSGWYIHAYSECKVKGVKARFEEKGLAFGNSDIHSERPFTEIR